LKILFFRFIPHFWKFYFLIFGFTPAGPPAGALRGKLLKELRRFFRIFGNFIFHFLDSFRIFGKSLKELRSIELMSYNLEG
jgi:hypothetical protein